VGAGLWDARNRDNPAYGDFRGVDFAISRLIAIHSVILASAQGGQS
jgi:hypothetical protein